MLKAALLSKRRYLHTRTRGVNSQRRYSGRVTLQGHAVQSSPAKLSAVRTVHLSCSVQSVLIISSTDRYLSCSVQSVLIISSTDRYLSCSVQSVLIISSTDRYLSCSVQSVLIISSADRYLSCSVQSVLIISSTDRYVLFSPVQSSPVRPHHPTHLPNTADCRLLYTSAEHSGLQTPEHIC